MVQLYLPWRDENELIHADGSYRTTYNEVKEQIQDALLRHQPYNELNINDLEDQIDIIDDDNDDNDDNNHGAPDAPQC